MNKYLICVATALALVSCGGNQHKADDPLADSGRTQRTENLLNNLKALGDSSVYLFGHQDDTLYGIGWAADYDNDSTIHTRSDVKSVCNDYPALISFDISNVETGSERNLDSVPFQRIRQEIIAHYDKGGMVSLSWTVQDDANPAAVADFLLSLETPYGVRVPVIFRLRGEFNADDWKSVVECFREHHVTNALYAYAPDTAADGDETHYMERYPGDDIIDLFGLDCYCVAPDADTTAISLYAQRLSHNLDMVCSLAKAHGKAAALTETGYEGIRQPVWWTQTLAPVLDSYPISYVLVWRNAHERPSYYFAPYPGHPSSSDFVRFYNSPATLFLRDVNALYLKH